MTTAHSPETQSRIAILRAKCAGGEPLTLEEAKEAVALVRADRFAAASASAASGAKKARAKKEVRSADDMLGELDGL